MARIKKFYRTHFNLVLTLVLLAGILTVFIPVDVSVDAPPNFISISIRQARAAPSSPVYHTGAETGGFAEATSHSASSISSSIVHSGNWSYRCPYNAASPSSVTFERDVSSGSVWVYLDALPAFGDVRILRWEWYDATAGNWPYTFVDVDSSGNLEVEDNDSTYDPPEGEWFRISWSWRNQAGSRYVKVWANGNQIIDELVSNFNGAGTENIQLLGMDIDPRDNGSNYFDDLILDDTENGSDIGDIRIIAAVPQADGTHDDWKDTGNGATTYDDVDETPPSVANTADYAWFEANGALNQQTWTINTTSSLGITGSSTVEAVSIWYYYETAGGGDNEYYTYEYFDGNAYSNGIADPKDPTWTNIYYADAPDSGSWTNDDFDILEIGMATDDANKDIWCYTAVAMVAYEYSAAGGTPDISVSPSSYDFGSVAESSTYNTTISYFTLTNASDIQTDQSISVVYSNWTGGINWTHSDTCTAGTDTVGLNATRGTPWGTSDIIVKFDTPNYIYENCPASTNYTFGLMLYTPTSFSDGQEKTNTVRITAVSG